MRATPPPISGPRWFGDDDDDEGAGEGVGEAVCMIMFVVVMRPPFAAEVTVMTETTLTRLVGDCFAAPPPACCVVEVEVVVGVVDVEDVVEEEEEEEEDDDVVDVVSLEVVAPLPWFPFILAEATAGPVVLIEATELPADNGKKSSEFVLSQQTLDAFRLWSQHQFPPWPEH